MSLSYDYVVIGGGSAGSVIASRLSARPENKVLLLEAGGPDRSILLRMPVAFRILRSKMLFDWGYASEPEPHAAGRRIPAARGKVLGGSSSVNGMMYSRGHPRDYDQWAQMGAQGWSFDEVLPYFRRSESNWRGGSHWHGKDGEMSVSPMSHDDPLTRAIEATARQLGHPVTDDFESDLSEGFGLPDLTTHRGHRASASKAFLDPVRRRPNLTIVTGAHVTRVVVENRRAVAVEYLRRGLAHRVEVGREAILSGGAFASPQLLMLSGIGPADHLRSTGVSVVHDLPGVGRGLQEHPLVAMGFRAKRPFEFGKQLRADRIALSAALWQLTGRGFMASQPLTAAAFYKSRPGLERPDLENLLFSTNLNANVWFPGLLKRTEDMLTSLNVALHPESRGFVELATADPLAKPRIQFNLLAEVGDMALLRHSIRWTRDLMAEAPVNDFVGDEIFPGRGAASDADIDTYIRKTALTAQHPTSSCRMGGDAEAVVDPELRVRGVKGLRVADASVMPTLIGGHTNAPSIMIGERAADFLLASG